MTCAQSRRSLLVQCVQVGCAQALFALKRLNQPLTCLTLLNGALTWVVPDFRLGNPLVRCIFNLASVLGALFSREQAAVELLLEMQHLLWLLEIQVGAGVPEALHAVPRIQNTSENAPCKASQLPTRMIPHLTLPGTNESQSYWFAATLSSSFSNSASLISGGSFLTTTLVRSKGLPGISPDQTRLVAALMV